MHRTFTVDHSMKAANRFKEPLVQSLRTRSIAIVGAAAVAALSASLVFGVPSQISAQPDPVGMPSGGDQRRQLDPDLLKQRHDQMHARVAANLGVTPERLAEAF